MCQWYCLKSVPEKNIWRLNKNKKCHQCKSLTVDIWTHMCWFYTWRHTELLSSDYISPCRFTSCSLIDVNVQEPSPCINYASQCVRSKQVCYNYMYVVKLVVRRQKCRTCFEIKVRMDFLTAMRSVWPVGLVIYSSENS